MGNKIVKVHEMTKAELASHEHSMSINMMAYITDAAAGEASIAFGTPTGQEVKRVFDQTAVEQQVQTAVSNALKKVSLIGTGSKALTYSSHNGAEVHAESGVTEVTMALTDFQVSGVQQTGSLWMFNYTGSPLPLKLGAGWSGGISEDGDTTNDLSGAGTLVNIPHAKKALVIFDEDGWVRTTLLGVEVTTASMNAAITAAFDTHDHKMSVRVGTTANITLSATQTIDGIAVVAGNRVLVKNQTTGSANGIYVVASGAWTRATDADGAGELNPGSLVYVEEGTTQAKTYWTLTNAGTVTLGTTALTFEQSAVSKALLDAALLAKSDDVSMQRVHTKAFTKTPVLAHPINFAAYTTTDTDGTYTVSALAEYNATYAAWKAFDNVDVTDWAIADTTDFWISIQMPVAKIITRVIVKGRATGSENITSWRVEGSNDNVIWDTLYSSSVTIGATVGTFDFANTKAYTRYRLFAVTGTGNPQLARLEFHESTYTATPTTHSHSDATTSVSGYMSGTDKTKLDGIATGAEVNVQADWNQATTTSDDFIKNKPTIPSAVTVNNTLTSTSTTEALSAAQGKSLKDTADTLATTVSGKASSMHSHSQSDVTSLTTDLAAKEVATNKVTAFSSPTDTQYPSAKLVSDQLALKSNTNHSHSTPITEVRLSHPVNATSASMTGTDGTYTVTVSGEYSATYAGWKVFDNNDATDWATNSVTANYWVALQFPLAKVVTKVLVRGRTGSTEDTTSWRIDGSNDGTTWTTLHTSSTQISDTLVTETFTNTTAYNRYRFYGLTSTGGSNPQTSRLEFHETVAVPTVPTTGATLNTEYASPEQHGGIFGTVYRQYFNTSLPSILTSGNIVTSLVDYMIRYATASGRGIAHGWSSDGTNAATIILSGTSGGGNLTLTLSGTILSAYISWVDYCKA